MLLLLLLLLLLVVVAVAVAVVGFTEVQRTNSTSRLGLSRLFSIMWARRPRAAPRPGRRGRRGGVPRPVRTAAKHARSAAGESRGVKTFCSDVDIRVWILRDD